MRRTDPSDERARRISISAFTIMSSAAIILAGAIISVFIARSIRDEMVEAWVLATASQVHGVVQSSLPDGELNAALTSDMHARLRRRVAQMTAGTDIQEVKIWCTNGTVFYSENANQIGRRLRHNQAFQRAMEGQPSFELSEDHDVNHDARRRASRVWWKSTIRYEIRAKMK